jgi:hypothetical protein
MTRPLFLPHDGILLRRTELQRGINGGASCDSTVRLPGTPLRGLAPTITSTIARFYLESALCLACIVGALVFVGWLADGFGEGVPTQVELDDGPQSEVGP